MPPLQEIPLQEVPPHQTGQVPVEQEVYGLLIQVNLRRAQSGFQATPQIYSGLGQVCREGGFREQLMVHRAGG